MSRSRFRAFNDIRGEIRYLKPMHSNSAVTSVVLLSERNEGYAASLAPVLGACPLVFAPVLADFVLPFDHGIFLPHAETACIVTSKRAAAILAPFISPDMQLYAVGPATARALQTTCRVRGTKTGCSAALAAHVLANCSRPRIVVLQGTRSLPTITKMLDAAGRRLFPCTVYETKVRPPPLLPPLVDTAHPLLVFFSPSAVDALAPEILPCAATLMYAAIGETTAKRIREVLDTEPLVAITPTPAGLQATLSGLCFSPLDKQQGL